MGVDIKDQWTPKFTCMKMIDKIFFKHIKSYKHGELVLSPLTLLIGANASGKSNAIEAIRFLSWLAEGRRLDDIMERVQEADVAIRGKLDTLIYDQATDSTLTLGCTLSNVAEWKHFEIKMRLRENDELRIVNEQITSEESTVPLYVIKHPAEEYSREVTVAYNNFAQGGRKPVIACTDRQAVFTQLDIPSRFNPGSAQEKIPEIVLAYQETLRNIYFLDPVPRQMDRYHFVGDNELRGDGSNLSSVLFDLCKNQGKKEDVLNFIRSLPEQDIVDIKFLKTPRNEVMLQLIESFAGAKTERDVTVLSDGTLRVLAVAGALLSAKAGALVIIEEIDNGVHPSRAKMLLENIERIARLRKLRVLLTSHNPALLDALPPSAVPDVVCCYRDPEQGDSRLVKLSDIHEYPELIARGPIGHLMTEGILEEFLMHQRTKEEKIKAGKSWLESFRTQVETI